MKDEIGSGKLVDIIQCDFSDILSVRRAADELVKLCATQKYTLRGILCNAGVSQTTPTPSAQGWDTTFATNHLGQIAFTESLLPRLPDGCQLLYVTSKVEDPDQPLPKKAGLRGGRFISVKDGSKGVWDMTDLNGGPSKLPGANAYATSKQCLLASVYVLARENSKLRINAIEPGWLPGTGLSRDAGFFLGLLARWVLAPISSRLDGGSTLPKTSDLLCRLLLADSKETGVYYNEKGQRMQASVLVRDQKHQELVMRQTRELLATV